MFKEINELVENEFDNKQVNKLAAIGWSVIALASAGVIFGAIKIVETLKK